MSDSFNTVNPATGENLKTYDYQSDAQANAAIEKCHAAFLEWRSQSHLQRGEVITQIGKQLRDNKDELATLMTREMGKLVQQSRDEVDLCAAICDWTAAQGPDALACEERPLEQGKRGLISYAPIGVIYGIQPWNYPAYQVVRYAIANLMAGNGVLLKHAASVTGCGLLLEQLFRDAGLPANLFTALVISHEQSNKVIEHPLVRGVTLTGSPDAGRAVAEIAGAQLKKTVLELGSNDGYLVLEDADLGQAVAICVQGRVYNNGETCIAAKRFIVVDAVFDEFKTAFVEKMSQLKLGDPMEKDADMGPMAREDLRDTLHEQVQDSVANGAEILCGGTMPEGDGFYYPATVLGSVTPGQPAYDDELFGPVASLIHARDEEDAIRIANDSRFGLGGGILTVNTDKAIEIATKHFDTGMVFINGFGLAVPNMPFGGVKDSGYGREHGGFGMKEFVNTKAVMVMS